MSPIRLPEPADPGGAPGAPRCAAEPSRLPPATRAVWCVRTESGSAYVLALDADGHWWFGGTNVPNARSAALPAGRYWRVEPPVPWPPALGGRLWVEALRALARDDPDRIPGGGKHTSAVRAVEMLLGATTRRRCHS